MAPWTYSTRLQPFIYLHNNVKRHVLHPSVYNPHITLKSYLLGYNLFFMSYGVFFPNTHTIRYKNRFLVRINNSFTVINVHSIALFFLKITRALNSNYLIPKAFKLLTSVYIFSDWNQTNHCFNIYLLFIPKLFYIVLYCFIVQ